MNEAIPNSTDRFFPTFKRMWASRFVIAKYILFGWFLAIKWVYDQIFNRSRWKQYVRSTDLGKPIIETIIQTVKKTRLWDGEKKMIAVELVSHFQDGIDADTSSEELYETFGDVKQTARLMRRAKKRCRPLWWQAWWWMSRGVATFIICYIFAAVWQAKDRPAIVTDYLAMINSRAESEPMEQRAWPKYREAIRIFNFVTTPKWYDKLEEHEDIRPSAENWEEMKAWLVKKKTAFSLLREGGKLRGLGFTVWHMDESFDPADQVVLNELHARNPQRASPKAIAVPLKDRVVINTFLPHLDPLRRMTYLLRADAFRAAMDHDGVTAKENIEAMLGISKQVEEIPFIVNEMVACVFQNICMHTVCDILAEYPQIWTDEQLIEIAHAISAHRLHPENALRGDKMSMDDIIQRLYSDDGNGDGRITRDTIQSLGALIPRDKKYANSDAYLYLLPDKNMVKMDTWMDDALGNRFAQVLLLPTVNTVCASRKEVTDRFEQFIEYQIPMLSDSRWITDPEMPDWLKSMRENPWEQKKYWLVNIFSSNVENIVRTGVQRALGYKEGALIGIALEMHRRKNGSWPATLDELSPKYIPALPLDRFTGKPLIYKIVDSQPLVYSVGADEDDDGGRLPKESNGRWIDYVYQTSARFSLYGQSYKKVDKSKFYDGDWVIWTLLPEHRTLSKPKEIKETKKSDSDSTESSEK